jgi:dTDP-4-dehydrorhamnose reductase
MKKVLVLGSNGMLGHVLTQHLLDSKEFIVINASHSFPFNKDSILIDVTDLKSLESMIKDIKPNYIVNCVGILIRNSNHSPSKSIFINSFLPHFLSELSVSENFTLIHLSTDCVFSGKKGSYSETEMSDAYDIYGKSKSLGEVCYNKSVVLRTSIIGPEIKTNCEGLFDWFFSQEGEVNGFTSVFWGGITTLELSKSIITVINRDLKGLFHITNGSKISKYELLSLLKKIWNKSDIKININSDQKIDKSLKPSAKFDFHIPSYFQMLSELKIWIKEHENLYLNKPNYLK